MAVGALEPKFNQNLFEADVYESPRETIAEMERIFKSKTREEWTTLFDGESVVRKNACVTPVLDIDEAAEFKHNLERESFSKEGTEKQNLTYTCRTVKY
ncbi:unnamed protein product [Strongylus vulgaris]|uniref:Uncharacterized protein n=1 Tax=Strongylus vulgaris TaxID=40348 RepID=A0A3P7I6V1_STRVU|nr:unnamed protein product [Strongylus vulgaris]